MNTVVAIGFIINLTLLCGISVPLIDIKRELGKIADELSKLNYKGE